VSAAEFLKKAESALASSKRDFEAGDYDGAANRLYYAMFHAARAALDSIGIPPQGKHGTIIARFGRHFCLNGPLPSELGRAINEAQELRVEGDYGSGTPAANDVATYLAKAEAFVAAVKLIISAPSGSPARP
jgi:uncharacterized protein (UPF0332 family)